MFLFSISLATSIIVLNVSVSLSILLNKALRSQNRFMYMLSTCLSDICSGVSYYYAGVLDVRDSFDSPTRTFYIVPTFLGLSYMAILAAQADRYHAIVSPFKYSQLMTRNRTLLVIFAYWVYAFLIVAAHNLVTIGVAKRITSMASEMKALTLCAFCPELTLFLTPILYIRGCSALRATLLTRVWRHCCRRKKRVMFDESECVRKSCNT
ncbi:hypothetical protein KUCAC02_028816 [Chaenocephalus aceratus]|uniref:Uncharacterized protein n=1 Tax=Chaenocephalus aceratus TaxID=36190 RepID=A0ACB9X4Z5_CHAAC|nr:hypothetical protein KUCAC02_028816 [Chaenocephalus aceratus]